MRTAHLFLPTTVSTRVTVTASNAGIPQLQNHSLDRLRIIFPYSNKTTRSTKPTRSTPPATQTEPSKARGNSCGRFPGAVSCGNFPREFHHRILEGPARGGAAVSLETFANYWVSQKNSDFWNFRYTIIHIWQLWTNNVPLDICQLLGVPENSDFWTFRYINPYMAIMGQ